MVGASVVTMTSLRASGTPASGEAGASPASRRLSTSSAAANAASAPMCRKALSSPSVSAMRSRCAWTTSREVTSREWIFSASSAADREVSPDSGTV